MWAELRPHCGKAYLGRLAEGTEPSDAAWGESLLVARFLDCSEEEIRIALEVGADRSRTWIVRRGPHGVRLTHDHRHADGSEDSVSRYGGLAPAPAAGLALDFPADSFTARLLPRAATNVWTLAVEPGRGFAYALRREVEGRRFRIEFDFARPAAVR
uniref:Uncharacterized protein n=1 Tax=Eiseniibacteriota bacterium TaxID=2212470 RepID=A0A832MJ74_UNCEI